MLATHIQQAGEGLTGPTRLRHNTCMLLTNFNQWIGQMVKAWQTMAVLGAWQQDAFLLVICLVVCVMLFLSGTVIGLFVQSLWAIFIGCQTAEEEMK